MTSLNFKANYVCTSNIVEAYKDRKYQNCSANIVELDKNDPEDRLSLFRINDSWQGTYDENIYVDFISPHYKNNPRFFAVTTQKDSFEKVDPEKVLGLMETEDSNKKDDETVISFLQTKPDLIKPHLRQSNFFTRIFNRFDVIKKPFRHVGKSLLLFAQTLKPDCDVVLDADDSAREFYKKNGLVGLDGDYDNFMILRANKKKYTQNSLQS